MIIKRLAIILLALNLFIGASVNAQTPPDKPLTPQEWVDGMRVGSWWIFDIPPAKNNRIMVDFSPEILDSLQKLGINGGRLHWQAKDSFDKNNILLEKSVDALEKIVDAFMERDMNICLNVSFLGTHVDETTKQKHYNGWRQLSKRFKGKSHRLAMSPVIEFHGWEDMGYSRTVMQDSLNWLYDTLTVIFREDNPTRIMSYKPWGASKHAEFETLDFPFGNDNDSRSGDDFYYVASFSGAYGMGDWSKWSTDMSEEDFNNLKEITKNGGKGPKKLLGINKAVKFKNETHIPFWIDHWEANYWKATPNKKHKKGAKASKTGKKNKRSKSKRGESKPKKDKHRWTIEQNIAYIEYFNHLLEEIGSAGAGMQTRRFWNNETNDLIRKKKHNSDSEKMSIELIKLYKRKMIENNNINKEKNEF